MQSEEYKQIISRIVVVPSVNKQRGRDILKQSTHPHTKGMCIDFVHGGCYQNTPTDAEAIIRKQGNDCG